MICAVPQVLDKDSGNVKALYRRAQGHLAVGDFVEAEVDLRRALLEEPGNKDVRTLFKRYKEQVRTFARRMRGISCKNGMFAVMSRCCPMGIRHQPGCVSTPVLGGVRRSRVCSNVTYNRRDVEK